MEPLGARHQILDSLRLCLILRESRDKGEWNASRELLLDEEGSQMWQLPCASDPNDDELDNDPANDPGISGFGLVSEVGFAFLRKKTFSKGLVFSEEGVIEVVI